MVAYFNAYDMLPAHQSGFRRNHSTETLLVRLLFDLHSAMDAGKISLLALFDVSSVHGPLLHTIYTAGIGALLSSYGLLHQLHADEVRSYTHCPSYCGVTIVYTVRQLCL